MQQDYTINDAFHDGFECGLLYMIRYLEESPKHGFTNKDAAALAEHLESKKPWKTGDEWHELLKKPV